MPLPTAFITHPDCLLHDTGGGHPERPARMDAVWAALNSTGLLDRMVEQEPGPADLEWIERVHSSGYIRFVEEACLSGKGILDMGDTHISPESFDVARLTAGGAMLGVELVAKGEVRNAFVGMRPPGHHAVYESAMGFCLFNNVAVAARYAQVKFGYERVAILDWDVHHGNGTQDAFFQDPSVFFASLHQYPFYPGSGGDFEVGLGPGRGTNLNVPLPRGALWADYERALHEEVGQAIEAFNPDILLVSAGFDAHRLDPLADVHLETEDFARLTRVAMGWAEELCEGRLVSILEGGYALDALANSVVAHVRTLLGDDATDLV